MCDLEIVVTLKHHRIHDQFNSPLILHIYHADAAYYLSDFIATTVGNLQKQAHSPRCNFLC